MGGFELMKINTNSEKINTKIKEIFQKAGYIREKQFSDSKNEKLLGYIINFEEDT